MFKDAPSIQPELDDHAYILERQLKPEARTDIVRELSDLEVKPTSMIDVSDGLASECMHLMAASGLGVRLYEDKFPIDPKTYDTAREFNLDPTVCMLSGGEDYELLFTISPDDYEKLCNHPKLSFIGHMTENPDERIMVTKSGTDVELKAQGWDGIKQG